MRCISGPPSGQDNGKTLSALGPDYGRKLKVTVTWFGTLANAVRSSTTGRYMVALLNKLRTRPVNFGKAHQRSMYGTAHVVFELLDFISRLGSLVPKSMVNLIRFHGLFAPNSKYRAKVTPAGRVI